MGPILSASWLIVVLLHCCCCCCHAVVTRQSILEQSRLSPNYSEQLQKGVAAFDTWLLHRRLPVLDWSLYPQQVNQFLVEFIDDRWQSQLSIGVAKHAVLGIQTQFPILRGQLSRPWNALKSWRSSQPLQNRVPVPPEVLQAIFIACIDMGFSEPSLAIYWFSAAVLFRLAFYGLLRPGEMLNLRARDILIATGRGYEAVVLTIIDPKNRRSLGRAQHALIREGGCVRWTQWLISLMPPCFKIWPSDRARLVSFWNRALSHIGLKFDKLTLGCLRPGGASWYILSDMDLGRLKFLGRWSCESSMSAYIQEAMAMVAWAQLSDSEACVVHSWINLGLPVWRKPPCISWSHIFSRAKQWRAQRRGPRLLRGIRQPFSLGRASLQ